MARPAIRVSDLWKEYRLGTSLRVGGTLYDALTGFLRSPFGSAAEVPSDSSGSRFWALSEVDFDVEAGEVLGIIGRNGAGKSTLLKILTRITEPSRGRIEIRGRVASLLEVGTGFHPELTGRENIYLNGAILGMYRSEIARKFEEIVAFAEVEAFLDTPVKRYSSGMYVRLAFAVAAHLEPDVLIVDEVLAVGDANFQRKCLAKMGEARDQGQTVLFVSHNLVAVQAICTRALQLERGRVVAGGNVVEVLGKYRSSSEGTTSALLPRMISGGDIEIVELSVESDAMVGGGPVSIQKPFVIAIRFRLSTGLADFRFTLHVRDESGTVAFSTWNTAQVLASEPLDAGAYVSRCSIPGDLMNSGRYDVTLLAIKDGAMIDYVERALAFDIVDDRPRGPGYLGREPGVVQPLLLWSTTPCE